MGVVTVGMVVAGYSFAARLDPGGGLDGAFLSVGTAKTGHQGWSSRAGLDESVAAA